MTRNWREIVFLLYMSKNGVWSGICIFGCLTFFPGLAETIFASSFLWHALRRVATLEPYKESSSIEVFRQFHSLHSTKMCVAATRIITRKKEASQATVNNGWMTSRIAIKISHNFQVQGKGKTTQVCSHKWLLQVNSFSMNGGHFLPCFQVGSHEFIYDFSWILESMWDSWICWNSNFGKSHCSRWLVSFAFPKVSDPLEIIWESDYFLSIFFKAREITPCSTLRLVFLPHRKTIMTWS